jgi:hypothetical protein
VLPSVDFNDELLLAANEVADVSAYRHLPRELVSVELAIANAIP